MAALPFNSSAFRRLFKHAPEPIAGKSVIITGGSTGIGRAIAMLLVAKGARVLICGRHRQAIDEALRDIREVGGGEIEAIVADIALPRQAERLFKAADRQFGRLDVLINNAGLAGESVADTDYDAFRYVVETNLIGAMHCAQIGRASCRERV